jgi:fructose-1-phosphate kinase PfkB-like protein
LKIVDSEGKRLLSALQTEMDLVKQNQDEMQRTLSTTLITKEDMIRGCYKLLDKGAKRVLLSLGKNGAIITDGHSNFFCKSINVAVNSTVGAGDSMVAAASVLTERNASKEEILKSAVAAGTASITTPGTNLFYRDKFEEIYEQIYVEKL